MLTTLPLRQLHQVSEWAITISKGTFSFKEEKNFSPGKEYFLFRKRIFSIQEENIFYSGKEYFLSRKRIFSIQEWKRKFSSSGKKNDKRNILCFNKKNTLTRKEI